MLGVTSRMPKMEPAAWAAHVFDVNWVKEPSSVPVARRPSQAKRVVNTPADPDTVSA